MASKSIAELKGRFSGDDIFVLASGASMDSFPPRMFEGRTVIGVNEVYRDFPCVMVLAHHSECCQGAIDKGLTLVTSKHDCADITKPLNLFRGDYFVYNHVHNRQTAGVDMSAFDSVDRLAVSASTTGEAIHLAYYLGAATIILCGADHGRIDNRMNYTGYNGGRTGETSPAHLPMTEPLLLRVVNEVRKRGVPVVSMNPFINPGMEGHKYSRPPIGNVYIGAIQQPVAK